MDHVFRQNNEMSVLDGLIQGRISSVELYVLQGMDLNDVPALNQVSKLIRTLDNPEWLNTGVLNINRLSTSSQIKFG